MHSTSHINDMPITGFSLVSAFFPDLLTFWCRCRSVRNIDDSEPRCRQRAHLILAFKLTYVRRHHYTPASKLMYESFVSAGLPLYLRYPAAVFRVQPGVPLWQSAFFHSWNSWSAGNARSVLPAGVRIQSVNALNPQAMESAKQCHAHLVTTAFKLLIFFWKISYEIYVSKTMHIAC